MAKKRGSKIFEEKGVIIEVVHFILEMVFILTQRFFIKFLE